MITIWYARLNTLLTLTSTVVLDFPASSSGCQNEDFIYLFLERGDGPAKERERNINVWLTLRWPPLGTWPATQAHALTGNRTSDPLIQSPHSIHWATPARGTFLMRLEENFNCTCCSRDSSTGPHFYTKLKLPKETRCISLKSLWEETIFKAKGKY